jgi:hypothetical protein
VDIAVRPAMRDVLMVKAGRSADGLVAPPFTADRFMAYRFMADRSMAYRFMGGGVKRVAVAGLDVSVEMWTAVRSEVRRIVRGEMRRGTKMRRAADMHTARNPAEMRSSSWHPAEMRASPWHPAEVRPTAGSAAEMRAAARRAAAGPGTRRHSHHAQ